MLSIQIAPEIERRLRTAADRLQVPVDDLAAALLRDFVAEPDPEFENAVRLVIEKNQELYRRLA